MGDFSEKLSRLESAILHAVRNREQEIMSLSASMECRDLDDSIRKEMAAALRNLQWSYAEFRELWGAFADLKTAIEQPPETWFQHYGDYSFVIWGEERFSFTPNQRKCVGVLWEQMQAGAAMVEQRFILNAADVDARNLFDVFRVREGKRVCSHPAWKTMIVSPMKGSYAIRAPQ